MQCKRAVPWLFLALALASFLGLAGCGSPDATQAPSPAPSVTPREQTSAPPPSRAPTPTTAPSPTPPRAGSPTPFPPPTVAPTGVEPGTCTYVVAPEGDDGAPGTQVAPWATFEKAAATARPGDLVCFRGGTYPTGSIVLSQSGVPDAPITFAALPGEEPILAGGGEVADLLILEAGVSYLRISGFVLQGFRNWGLFVTGGNHDLHLDHLAVGGGEAGIRFTYGDSETHPQEGPVESISLEDSVFFGSEYTAVDCTPGPCNHMLFRRLAISGSGLTGEDSFGADGLAISRGYPVVVEDCTIHDNGGDGIDLNSRDREGHAEGVVVRRNRVFRNHQNGIKLWAGGRIENNLVWGQGNSAIWAGTFPGTLQIVNNTVAYNMWATDYGGRNWALVVGYPEEMDAPPVDLTLLNNLLAFNADAQDGGPTGIYLGPGVTLVDEGHNLYWSRPEAEITAEFLSGRDPDVSRQEIADGTWAALSGQGQGDLAADPQFLSGWPTVDLHLAAGSPAVDAGRAEGASGDDIDARPRDATPDLGAYEAWDTAASP
jgi:hypothetical protein